MSTRQHEPSDLAVHEFAQLLAGWVPDGRLAEVRRTLGAGDPAAAAAAAAALAAGHNVPLLAEDIAAGRALTGEPGALEHLRPVLAYPPLLFWFSAPGPSLRDGAGDPDQVMVQAARARRELIAGLWRAWRHPRNGPGEPASGERSGPPEQPHRVYTVQVPDGAVAPGLAGELLAALAEHAHTSVEVVALDIAPLPYQAAALDGSALLWDAQDEPWDMLGGPWGTPGGPGDTLGGPGGTPGGRPQFRIARVFDFAEPGTGPGFRPGHRVVTDPVERDRLLGYLASGTPVLSSTARAHDVLDPGAGPVVPTSFRTDGEWIWTDTVAYYLRQHDLAPDEELAAHIGARGQAGHTAVPASPHLAAAAADFLLHPPPEHARLAIWTAGTAG